MPPQCCLNGGPPGPPEKIVCAEPPQPGHQIRGDEAPGKVTHAGVSDAQSGPQRETNHGSKTWAERGRKNPPSRTQPGAQAGSSLPWRPPCACKMLSSTPAPAHPGGSTKNVSRHCSKSPGVADSLLFGNPDKDAQVTRLSRLWEASACGVRTVGSPPVSPTF